MASPGEKDEIKKEEEKENIENSAWPPPSEELRSIMKQLYADLSNGTLTAEQIQKKKRYLDLDIRTYCLDDIWNTDSTSCDCATVFEVDGPESLEKQLKMIEGGCCPCVQNAIDIEISDLKVAGKRLLHLAASTKNYIATFKTLMENGCDCSARTFQSCLSVMEVAASNNNIDALLYLDERMIGKGFDQQTHNDLLLKAAQSEELELFKTLLNMKSVSIDYQNSSHSPLLRIFSMNASMTSVYVKLLLKAGYSPNIVGQRGHSLLHMAVLRGDHQLVQMFVDHGAKRNQSKTDVTILVRPIYTGDAEMMEILLKAGADPNESIANDGQNTPLIYAAYDGHTEVMKTLLKYDANVNKLNSLEYSALHIAAWNGHEDAVNILLSAGATHDAQTLDKNTPLALTAHGNHLQVMKILLPLGCNVNNADKDLDTPLHYAAYNGMTEAMELLIQYGADPNALNHINTTPLWNAVFQKQKEAVKLLIVKNVKLETKSVGIDQHSQTDNVVYVYSIPYSPLWVALRQNCPEIALLLVTAGYNIYQEDWLVKGEIPEAADGTEIASVLEEYVHTPPRLIALCQTFFRGYFGLRLTNKVKQLDIPKTIKNYLILKDLTNK